MTSGTIESRVTTGKVIQDSVPVIGRKERDVRIARWSLVVVASMAAAGCSGGGDGSGGLEVVDAWARPTPAGVSNGAVYFEVRSDVADELVSVSVDASVAGKVSLHETTAEPVDDSGHDDDRGGTSEHGGNHGSDDAGAAHGSEHDMMVMREVESVVVPAGGEVRFEPGGLHVMLEELVEPLEAGDEIELTLTFAHSPEVVTTVMVREE